MMVSDRRLEIFVAVDFRFKTEEVREFEEIKLFKSQPYSS